MRKWILYILKCGDNSLYTGITTDLEKRLKRHKKGRAARYTRRKLPVKLLYRECCAGESKARRREAEIKKMPRSDKLALIRRTSALKKYRERV